MLLWWRVGTCVRDKREVSFNDALFYNTMDALFYNTMDPFKNTFFLMEMINEGLFN